MKRKSLQDDNLIVRWELFTANFDVCSMSRCRHRFNWREGVKFRIFGCKRCQDKIVTFLLKILCFTFYRVTKQVLDGELLLKIMEIRKISKSHEIRQIEVRSILSLKVNIISRFPRQIEVISALHNDNINKLTTFHWYNIFWFQFLFSKNHQKIVKLK